jgi:transposase
MSGIRIEEFYGQSIGVKAPWRVSSVCINAQRREVQILVECNSGEVWMDPECGERAEIKDWQERTWRHLDTCEYQTIVRARVPRLKLRSGRTMMVAVPWAEPGGRFTLSFEACLIELLEQSRTVKGAARIGRVTEDQIDGVMQRAVARGLERRKLEALGHIGLDEKSFRKGHRYVTVLSDLDAGRVLEVVEERTVAATREMLEKLPQASRQSIEAVAMDMWPAYQEAVAQVLPQADVVFDRFHVAKHLNEAVDKVRRKEHRALSAAGQDTLKSTKYHWLKARLDLRTRTGIAFRKLLNEDLQTATAWALKTNFHHFWSYRSWAWACSFLANWVEAVSETGLKPMEKVARMLDQHAEGLLNYIAHRITNAASEGINSTIQGLKCAARGLPNFQSLRSRILFFLGKLKLRPA